MTLIPCTRKCKYQLDGCCTLEKIGAVNCADGGCAYFIESDSGDKLHGVPDRPRADDLNAPEIRA